MLKGQRYCISIYAHEFNGHCKNLSSQDMHRPKLSLAQLKQMIANEAQRHATPPPQPAPAIEYKQMEPELKPVSPGQGTDVDFF